jgi:hypothetical protein
MNLKLLALINLVFLFSSSHSLALPPPEEIPEEVLRTEIILDGRSPVDGQPLSAAEYEDLQADLAQSSYSPELEPDVQQIIFLLQIRKFFKTVIPFY